MNPFKLMRACYSLLFVTITFLVSCSKETEEFETEALANYLPTQTGKYITYRVDSTLFPNFGGSTVVHSYQEKHQIDSLLTDNLGRPSYRVFRFLRNVNGTGAWQPSGSYFITPMNNTIEVIENNLRFLKLTSTIREGNSWKGNRYLGVDPYGSSYEFSNDNNIAAWDYTYTVVGDNITLGGKAYSDVITVDQVDESINAPVTNTDAYGYKNYSVDKYAKGIGLIYQEIIMWEYQPPSSGRPGYQGFGVKRSIVDHN